MADGNRHKRRQSFMRWERAWIASFQLLGHLRENAVLWLKRALGKIWLNGNRDAPWLSAVCLPNERRSATAARLLTPK